ncbi:restriction endonuclease subunit S [Acinetobacter cumulans]|uniref:Restriction endonuclease subunit S n=1 Tax=Acinetobacter cumulans TaxID=2136182 RepID=A0A3A8FPI6_9GAMM|nr:restriction endonuclease subunit S [Acinetobacter cumulans]RKG48865.1 restriction endonuclease subunit S [Acinetobacter cumulans]
MSQLPRYENYKDSGVQWLGEIPSHWKCLSIKRLTLVKRGASPRPIDNPEYFDDEGEYAWVRIADVTASDKYLLETTQRLSELGSSLSVKMQPDSIFLSIAGSVGKPIITKVKACIHDGFVYFPDWKESINFLYYIFASGQPYLGLGKLGTQLNLNTDTVGNIKIALPPSDEQEAIVDFLDKRLAQVDTLIAKQETLLEKLAEQRVALISHAVTKGLNPDVEMKESGVEWLGKVPKSWCIANLRYFISCNSGDALESSRILRDADEFNNIPVIGGNGLLGFTENSNYKKECIAVGRVGALCGNVHFINYESWINDNALLIKLISDKFNINYLVYLLRSRNLNELASKTAQPLLTGTQVKAEKVCIPLMKEQLEIVRYLDTNLQSLDRLLETVNKTIQTLREYRSTLITQVVTGKIDVRNLKLN